MKNSILFSFILILSFTSCKQKDSPKNHSISDVAKSLEDIIADHDCFSSYQIYSETAYLWQEGWVSYYNRFRGGSYKNSPRVSFDAQNLNILYNEVKDKEHPGILMWYTLLDPSDSIPSLAIQNTVACEIDPAGTILLAAGNDVTSTVDTISEGYLDTIKQIWNDAGKLNPNAHTEINGYNYLWDSIQSLMNLSTGSQGIYIHYGLRTIGPDESSYYGLSTDPNKTGSVVYCNVLYGNNFEADSSATLLDFAMPCPRFCGDIK